ncbi:MAG: Tellurite resistance protein-related protein [uncultured Sulfurovum sp.]|uniref:Tellurite resistance protein-related protein n=1 Tax=uncultured Sulfurovum sp. TaxID=269237 RepID=A0A6S6T3J0_9BACT|nr:MAG: Tellurite resistance protein-related protein [uncultured Sulfurovum sp.]
MSIEDKKRWNKKYNTTLAPINTVEVVKQFYQKAKGKQVLDIACGKGRNSIFLAKEGFEVDALDISEVAIESLKNIDNITPKVVDFDNYKLEEDIYDLIICTYFLERKLFLQIKKALKNEGLFIFETFMHHEKNTKVPSNRAFLLEQGELENIFKEDYEILLLNEFMDEGICGDKSMKISMVAKKKKGKE